MNNLAFGQYYNSDSVLHRLDPRTKLISLILLMISIFTIKQEKYGYSVTIDKIEFAEKESEKKSQAMSDSIQHMPPFRKRNRK